MGGRVTVFPEWHGKEFDDVVYECRELLEDENCPTLARWRDAGGKSLGHFQVYFPEEIAHAAGMLPVKVCGSTLDPLQAESRFGSYICSILKTSLELGLRGSLNLDMFVSHPICDAARNLAAIWGRNFDYQCQILYLPQNPNSRHSATYLRDEYARVLGDVERVAGCTIDDDSLRASMALFNENRALLRDLYEVRRTKPWMIDVHEAYVLMRVGGIIPREEHNELLRWMLARINKRGRREQDRIKVVFEGGFCEQPPLDLLRTIGQSCYVVDDDLMIGMRWILEDVDPGDDALAALAHAYLECSSYSPVQHDLRKPKEKMLLERIRASGAEAVIVAAAKMCEPGLEEQVAYTRTLDDEDIPYFVSEFQENMTTLDALEIQLETFVENLLFA